MIVVKGQFRKRVGVLISFDEKEKTACVELLDAITNVPSDKITLSYGEFTKKE